MVVISKHIVDTITKDMPCYTVMHPGIQSCLKTAPFILKETLIGCAKFYSLIYGAQLLIQGKNLKKKKTWMTIAKSYGRSTITSVLISATGLQLVCLMRHIFGKFLYYYFLSVPFTLTGVFLSMESPSRRILITNFFANLMIEYCLRCVERAGYIAITKTKQVLMFMIGSSILLYLMRLERENEKHSPLFWLIIPEKVTRKSTENGNICPHKGECKKHILKHASTYFGIGLAVSLAKLIIPQIKTPIKAISSIRGRHFKLALFFSSYIGIYKAVICYLCRRNGYDSALYAVPAGCTAGLSMLFNPNLGLAIASFTAVFKLYSTTLYEKKILPANLPLSTILFCLCQGTLYHARIFDSEICPRYLFYLMNRSTNGIADSLFNNFCKKIQDQ